MEAVPKQILSIAGHLQRNRSRHVISMIRFLHRTSKGKRDTMAWKVMLDLESSGVEKGDQELEVQKEEGAMTEV